MDGIDLDAILPRTPQLSEGKPELRMASNSPIRCSNLLAFPRNQRHESAPKYALLAAWAPGMPAHGGVAVDPITLILTALAMGAAAAGKGATEGLTDAAKDAVTGLYGRLKTALVGKAGGAEGADWALQGHEKNPAGYEAPVRDLVTNSGADRDADILALAQELLTTIEQGRPAGNSQTTTLIGTAKDKGRVYQAGRDMNVTEK